jgi:hypothetical protein
VKLRLRKFGGIIPIREEVQVDLASLPASDAEQLASLAKAVFSKQPTTTPARPVPDVRGYQVTIDEGDVSTTRRFTDLSIGPDEATLIDRIESLKKQGS